MRGGLINEISLPDERRATTGTRSVFQRHNHAYTTRVIRAYVAAGVSRSFTALFPARKSKCTPSLTTCLFVATGFWRAPAFGKAASSRRDKMSLIEDMFGEMTAWFPSNIFKIKKCMSREKEKKRVF